MEWPHNRPSSTTIYPHMAHHGYPPPLKEVERKTKSLAGGISRIVTRNSYLHMEYRP